MAVGIGQRCLVRVKIADVELRNAKDIVATVESPQYVAHCQEVSFDEVSGLVYVAVDVNIAGPYSMWLEVRFAEEVVYTPAFVFAEVEGEATPCDAPYIVDVEISGESITVTPPKVDVDAVSREEFEQLSKDVANKVDKVEGKGLSSNDFTDDYKEKVDKFTIDKELSATSDNAIANSAVTNAISELPNKDGNYPNMSVGMADKVKGVNQVQEALTLTTKANGNIVIGNLAGQTKEFMPATPSGDPMHYMYEAEGAVWNGNTWETTYLTNITNEEMRHIYNLGHIPSYTVSPLYGDVNKYRTNLPRLGSSNTLNWDFYSFAQGNNVIEVIDLTLSKNYEGNIAVSRGLEAFKDCTNLREIYGRLNIDSNTTNMFNGCASLNRVRVYNLKLSISFADSPLLSKESLLYMIDNCASNATFTITLHPDVYAKCQEGGEWYSEVNTALSAALSDKTTTITLASA